LGEALFAIGVDLGGQSVKLALVDRAGRILTRDRQPVDAEAPAEVIQHRTVEAIRAMQLQAGQRGCNVSAVGMVLPGYMDRARTRLLHAANLPTLGGTDFLQAIRETLELPVVFDSDANAAAFGEYHFGTGRGVERLIVTTVGTGVGAGVVIAGRVLRIWNHIAGSLGHLVVDPHGVRCACGGRGCLETRASGRALERRACEVAETRPDGALARLQAETGRLTGIEVGQALRDGDPEAAEVVHEVGWWLGVGIASWSVIYRPDRVLIGGGIAGLGAPLLEAIRQGVADVGQPDATARLEIDLAGLGPDAGVIGAAAMAMLPVEATDDCMSTSRERASNPNEQ